MNEPIKVVWKFKNNNRRTQYHQYIFIGQQSSSTMKILNKIKDLNFYDTLINLSKDEFKTLEKIYGEYWYNYFFNNYHINAQIYIIKESTIQKNELSDKYGKEWVDKHIIGHQLMEKKLIYSYQSLINDILESKNKKKTKEKAFELDLDDKDFTTNKKINLDKIFKSKLAQRPSLPEEVDLKGGFDDEVDTEDIVKDDDDDINIDENIDKEEKEDEGEDDKVDKEEDEQLEEQVVQEEDIDLEEIEQIYKDADVVHDKEVAKTSELIQKALDDNKAIQKKMNEMIEFDTSKDNSIYDENLRDVISKIYVVNNYIYKDDTVKMIKDKICCSIKNNAQYGEQSYLLPSRQYIWSEYYFNDTIEKIMIGQKWLRRNEMLNVDVEPNNNLRIYEELDNTQIKNLRDSIKRYTSRIRREDDETNILTDYEDYISNNEIFMLDVYNEFGFKYNPSQEIIKNLTEVYLKIYFPKIRLDEVKNIIDYLSTDITSKKVEENRMINVFETINNDLILENEIMTTVENVKITADSKKLFKTANVIQSIVYLRLRLKESLQTQKTNSAFSKLDLYRIFNEFIVNKEYPFVLYQTIDGNIVYKFHEEEINKYMSTPANSELLTKWFENTPIGITCRFPITDKFGERFLSVTINDNGRMEYKIVWKEEDNASFDDLKLSFPHINKLINKLNSEKNRQRFYIPEESEFKYAFINTVQKFELPEKFNINHNDISEFARFFYPYVALVIEPRKRQSLSDKEETGKYGTYLRFKRVSKYDNQTKIEMRIIHLLSNYDATDKQFALEVSKQFNITEDKALEEIEKVKQRYPNIKKSRKVLKKLESLPKYKSPGIEITIQGKTRDKYKIRISGARNREQLNRMINFINTLIFLYIETYLYKKPERQELKNKLKELTKIAKRRNKVLDLVFKSEETKTVKQMAKQDKQRIGYKPEEGQSQWTRCCQNSGEGKRRRPMQYTPDNMADLLKMGYKLNKKTGVFERRVLVKNSKNKKEEVILKTLKFAEFDKDGEPTGNEIHYACDPEINGEQFYVGFLSRCKNPYGHCMPCCFKKDPAETKNKQKQKFYSQCLGVEDKKKSKEEIVEDDKETSLEKFYILHDTNKLQEDRLGLLPKYLDFFFNIMNNKDKFIKNHYLTKTVNGYYFKIGSKQDSFSFLNAVGKALDMSVEDIKSKLIEVLEKDRSSQIYTSLNNGDIKTQKGDVENFIKFIKNNSNLDYELMNNLLSVPGILDSQGLNILVFSKKVTVIKKQFEKEKIKEDFIMLCQNIENIYPILSSTRKNIFIIKDGKIYNPVVLVNKDDEGDKILHINKTYKFEDNDKNIVKQISNFYISNCKGSFLDRIIYRDNAPIASEIYYYIEQIKNSDYKIKYQNVDTRNKTKFFITENNTIVPTRPSGSLYNVQIVKSIDKYIKSFKETYNSLNELFKLSGEKIPCKPIGVYYETEIVNNNVVPVALVTLTNDSIPILPSSINIDELKKMGLFVENAPIIDKIDNEIIKRKVNLKTDERVMNVNLDEFLTESYELFRLELSNYINRFENSTLKEKIIKIINNNKLNYEEKVDNIRLILYKLINSELYNKYKKYILSKGEEEVQEIADIEVNEDAAKEDEVQEGGKYDKLLHISKNLPDVKTYEINNDRTSCQNNKNKDTCNKNIHCHWTKTGCYMSITQDEIIKFINKVSEELASNDRKSYEILKLGDYFVSDIVDFNKYTERTQQTILRHYGSNIKKILSDIFGENIPQIGKRKLKDQQINYTQLNEENQLQDMKEYLVQRIIPQNMSFYRAYVNGYHWIKNKFNENETRNLGYYSPLQTSLASYFRGSVIDYLKDNKNKDIIKEHNEYFNLKKNNIKNYIIKVASENSTLTGGYVEFLILSIINKIPIIVYNDNNDIIKVFDSGKVNNKLNKLNQKEVINIRLTYLSNQHPTDMKQPPFSIETFYFN